MDIAILIYDRLAALDAIGPYEVLSRVPGATVTFVAEEAGEPKPGGHSPSASIPVSVSTDPGPLRLMADASLAELEHPEIVLVPGGPGQLALMDDGPVHAWLRAAHETSQWTCSVCTGSLILAAAGLLEGRRATSNWQALEELRGFEGVEVVPERVVFDGKLATSAGVTAGLDMALELAAKVANEQVAQAIQLGIEYDPQPPFDAGSPEKAPAEIVEAVRAYSRFTS
ncbi:MAG TPA: DJ-1/PfpI family protein [Solirubrobacteraceae bacterium]|jgi:putative intracellular protease/amidase